MRCIALIFVILALVQNEAFAELSGPGDEPTMQRGLGPLMVRSESPFQALRYTPVARDPYHLAPGETQFRAMYYVSNIWLNPSDKQYFLDFDMADMRLAIVAGLNHGWTLELGVNELRTLSSGLDQLILTFHDQFGISQDDREDYPKNATRISIPAYGIELDRSDLKRLSRSVDVTASKAVIEPTSRRPAVAVSGTLRYETLNDGPVEEGSADFGLMLSLAQPIGKHYIYANLTYTHFGSSELITLPLEDEQFTALAAYEWRTRPRQAQLLQYLYCDGVVKDLGALSNSSHEVHLGNKWKLKRFMWEFSITENIINYDNSPDVGITLGMVYSFN